MSEVTVAFSGDGGRLPIGRDLAASIMERWLGTRSASTRHAYRKDLGYLAKWMRECAGIAASSADDALAVVLAGPTRRSNDLCERWIIWMMSPEAKAPCGYAPATIQRRVSAVRSMCRLARRLGVSDVVVDAECPPVRLVRETEGPTVDEVRRVIREAGRQRNRRKALRDVALIAVIATTGLRRGEVVGLDPEDILGDAIRVRRKGYRQKAVIPLPRNARAKLERWFEVRDEDGEGVFHSLPHKKLEPGERRQRITGDVAWKIVRDAAHRAGIERQVRPHGLRHTAITAMLDAGYDVRQVRHFSGHSTVDGVIAYDDARNNYAREISDAMDAALGDEGEVN